MSRALAPYGGSSDSECARTASATDDNPSSRAFPTCLRCQLPLSARRSGAAFCVVPRTQIADSALVAQAPPNRSPEYRFASCGMEGPASPSISAKKRRTGPTTRRGWVTGVRWPTSGSSRYRLCGIALATSWARATKVSVSCSKPGVALEGRPR